MNNISLKEFFNKVAYMLESIQMYAWVTAWFVKYVIILYVWEMLLVQLDNLTTIKQISE